MSKVFFQEWETETLDIDFGNLSRQHFLLILSILIEFDSPSSLVRVIASKVNVNIDQPQKYLIKDPGVHYSHRIRTRDFSKPECGSGTKRRECESTTLKKTRTIVHKLRATKSVRKWRKEGVGLRPRIRRRKREESYASKDKEI